MSSSVTSGRLPTSDTLLWHHKFRTPRKAKKSKLSSQLHSKSLTHIETTKSSQKLTNTQQSSWRRNESKSNEEHEAPKEQLPITYEVMRSIVTALACIEERGDLSCESFLFRQAQDPNGMNGGTGNCTGTSVDSTYQIEEVSKLILDDGITSIETFANFKNASIITAGVKDALMRCEQIIPESMEHDLHKIEKHHSEMAIQNFLGRIPQIHMILFITLLQHVCKISKAKLSLGQSKDLFNQMAKELGDIVILSKCHGNVLGSWYQLRKKKLRRRIMKTFIRYFAIETKTPILVEVESPEKVCRPQHLFESNNCGKKEDEEALSKTDHMEDGKIEQNVGGDGQDNLDVEDDVDCNVVANSETNKNGMNDVLKNGQVDQSNELEDAELTPNWIKVRKRGLSFGIQMDGIKEEAMNQIRRDKILLNEARCRLNAAEELLKHHHCMDVK